MNVVGTRYFEGCNIQIGYDILGTNQTAGYHTLRIYLVLNVTNYWVSWTRGTARVWDVVNTIGTYYERGSYTLVYKDVDIYCDANGHASVYMDGSLDTTWISGAVDGTAVLPDIARTPILNSGSDFKDNENPVYDITAFGNYDLRVKLEAANIPNLIIRDLTTKYSTRYTLELTDEERRTLRNLMTGDSLEVKELVCGMQNGVEISSYERKYKMTKGSHYVSVRVNGQWKDCIPYVRVNGEWKEAVPNIRVNGQWKEGI